MYSSHYIIIIIFINITFIVMKRYRYCFIALYNTFLV